MTDQPGLPMVAFYDAATLDPIALKRRVDEIAPRLTWSREHLLRFQQERLQEILRHAADASPFYRETIGHLVRERAPLSAYPTMNKSILMSEFDRIVTDQEVTGER